MGQWDSEYYKKHATVQENWALKTLDTFSFKGDERVLDIGCGDGKVTRQIAERARHVVGIDVSPHMYAQAQKDFGLVPNLEFFQKSAEDFDFEEKFDIVTSFFALHWVKDHRKMLQNVKSVLNPGGNILFLFISGGSPAIGEVFEKPKWKPHVEKNLHKISMIEPSDYDQFLAECGLQKGRVERVELTYTFPNVQALQEHFMTWLPYFLERPKEECLEMALEMAKNVAKHRQQKEEVDLISSMLLVEAEK